MSTNRHSASRRLITATARRHRREPRFEVLESRELMTNVNWISTTGGSWNVGSNWSTGQVPGSGDVVTIDVAGNPTIAVQGTPRKSVRSPTTIPY